MFKKKLYFIHRTLSAIIGIPIFLWAISGLLHPIMTNIRPVVSTQSAPVRGLDSAALQQSLGKILKAHGIQEFYASRKVFMMGTWYEQVRVRPAAAPCYFRLQDGRLLPDGDRQYATLLARHFLTGEENTQVAVRGVRYLTQFTADYPSVNRVLPVYQVAFERGDDLSIFVNTELDQFSYVKDNNRAAFNWFFGFFHTWSWLDHFPGWKAGIIAFILLLALMTSVIGLYIAFTTKPKTKKGHRILKARRLHRVTALIGAFFILAWACSGLVHAIQNSLPESNGQLLFPEKFSARTLPDSPATVLAIVSDSLEKNRDHPALITDIQYLAIHQEPFMRISFQKDKGARKTDLMMDQQVAVADAVYYNLSSHQLLKAGDRDYAVFLAKSYLNRKYPMSGGSESGLSWKNMQVSYQTKFDVDYNFSDKILPVWKISADGQLRHTVFINTAARTLTKVPTIFGRVDAISFAFFHKHEFMGWAGKGVKDASTIIGVLLVLCMLIFGYRLFFLSRKKRKKSASL